MSSAGPNNIPAKGKLQFLIFRIDFTDSANSNAGYNLGILVSVTFLRHSYFSSSLAGE